MLEFNRTRNVEKDLSPQVGDDKDPETSNPPNTQPTRLKEGGPPLSLATIKEFLRFKASVGKGLLDKKKRITVDSLCTFSEWFFAGYTRVTGIIITEEDRAAVYSVGQDYSALDCRSC